MNIVNVEIRQINPNAVKPKRATSGSAAYDLFLPKDTQSFHLLPKEVVSIGLGFSIDLLKDDLAFIMMPRSGTGSRGLHLANVTGLVDSDYQGEITLKLTNDSNDSIFVDATKAVAQAIITPVLAAYWTEVEDHTRTTLRGEGGFGHTDSISP